jgi:endonuclease YncB( thermonuclease family)
MMLTDNYIRRISETKRVHDGDTFLFEIDQGMGDKREAWIRLKDIDIVELHEEYGEEARSHAEWLLTSAQVVIIQTFKTRGGEDKTSFIRYIADVYVDGVSIADLMKDAGFEKHDA